MSADGVFQATVTGDAEIRQRLLAFGDAVRVAGRRTLADIGRNLRDRIAAAAPRKTGALGDTTIATLAERGETMTETVRPTEFYAPFLVFGVVNHGTRNNKRSLGSVSLKNRTVRRGLVARVRELRAMGAYRITPRPFIGTTWDAFRPEAEAEIAAAVAEAVKGA